MHSDLESIVRSAIQYPHNPELAPLLGVLYSEPVAAPQNCRHPSQQGAAAAQVARPDTLGEGFASRIHPRNLRPQFYPNPGLFSTLDHFRPLSLTSADRKST